MFGDEVLFVHRLLPRRRKNERLLAVEYAIQVLEGILKPLRRDIEEWEHWNMLKNI